MVEVSANLPSPLSLGTLEEAARDTNELPPTCLVSCSGTKERFDPGKNRPAIDRLFHLLEHRVLRRAIQPLENTPFIARGRAFTVSPGENSTLIVARIEPFGPNERFESPIGLIGHLTGAIEEFEEIIRRAR